MLAGMALRRDTPKSKAWADKRTPLNRGKSLDRAAGPARGGPMRHRSPTMAAYYRDVRAPFVADLMASVPCCEAPALFVLHGVPDPLPHCTPGPLDPHERRRRGQGGSLENRTNILAICAGHHDRCTLAAPGSPEHLAHLVAFEGDDGWEALGARRGERKQRPA